MEFEPDRTTTIEAVLESVRSAGGRFSRSRREIDVWEALAHSAASFGDGLPALVFGPRQEDAGRPLVSTAGLSHETARSLRNAFDGPAAVLLDVSAPTRREVDAARPQPEPIRTLGSLGARVVVVAPVFVAHAESALLLCGCRNPARAAALEAFVATLVRMAADAVVRVRNAEAERRAEQSMDALHSALDALCEELDLSATLRRINDAAREAAHADLSALGIVGATPDEPFSPWVHSPVDAEHQRRVHRTPRPVGVLGLSPASHEAVRLDDVRDSPDFRGLPDGHMPLGPFLSVPIVRNGAALGNLYLSRRPGAAPFTDTDQRAVELLARHAAVAMGNVRARDVARKEFERVRQLSESLAETETFLRRTIDDAPIGTALVEGGGRFTRVNRAFCEMLGYRAEELLRLGFQDVTHPDDLGANLALAERLWRGEIPRMDVEKRYVRKDGRIVVGRLHTSLVHRADGTPLLLSQVVDVTEERRAHERLRASDDAFARAQALAHLGSWESDLVTGRLTWSPECYRLFGRDPASFSPTHDAFIAAVHPDDRVRVQDAVDAAIDGRKPYFVEHRIVTPDGTERLVHEVGEVARRDGRAIRMLGTVLDVTALRRAEVAAQRNESLLRKVLESLPVGVWVSNAEGVIELSNEAGRRIWGGARIVGIDSFGQYVGSRVADGRRIAAEDWAGARAIRRGETTLNELVRVRAFDGSERTILNSAIPVRDPSGRIIAGIVVNEDVTERQAAEAERERLHSAVAAERGWLEAVIESAPFAIVLLEAPDGRLLRANRRTEELTGARYVRGADLKQVVGGMRELDGRVVPLEELPGWRACRYGEVTKGREYLMYRPDGTFVPILLSAAPIPDASGRRGAVVMYDDISALKELERLREEWTSVVAHDLRQPVASIAAAAGMLARRDVDDAVRRRAGHILASTHRLETMIRDLLAASRLEAQRLRIHRRRVRVPDFLRGVVERLDAELAGHPVRIELADDLPLVEADPGRLEQIIGNLVSNAAKYGDPGTDIRLAARRDDGTVTFSVANRGPGIAPERIPTLFERFDRGGRSERDVVTGIGLGLYIARGLVEAHGGRVAVESTPGEWTTFRFTLPISSESDVDPSNHDGSPRVH